MRFLIMHSIDDAPLSLNSPLSRSTYCRQQALFCCGGPWGRWRPEKAARAGWWALPLPTAKSTPPRPAAAAPAPAPARVGRLGCDTNDRRFLTHAHAPPPRTGLRLSYYHDPPDAHFQLRLLSKGLAPQESFVAPLQVGRSVRCVYATYSRADPPPSAFSSDVRLHAGHRRKQQHHHRHHHTLVGISFAVPGPPLRGPGQGAGRPLGCARTRSRF